MEHYLNLLATTKNNIASNPAAANKIIEIYQQLKTNKELSSEKSKLLVQEALSLKGIGESEIRALLLPTMNLFCFPYAGGSSIMYDKWQSSFPENVRIIPIEYPGRGSKIKEPLISNFRTLLDYLENEVIKNISGSKTYAFFGHSLGAIIAFELALLLKKRHNYSPVSLYISASSPPHTLPSLFPKVTQMKDEDFIKSIQELNGTPLNLINTVEFTTFFLPILKNDFSLLDGYQSQSQILDCPITVFGGIQDVKVPLESLNEWRKWTLGQMVVKQMEGDHFFIHQPQEVIKKIKESLCTTHS